MGAESHNSPGAAESGRTRNVPEKVSARERDTRLDGEASEQVASANVTLSLEDCDQLGKTYFERFRRSGELSDINEAIKYGTCALDIIPKGHSALASRHANLGICYISRFRRLGNLNDLEKSIEHKVRALELTPTGHPGLSYRHASLGLSYSDRFERLGEMDDLEKSIKHRSCALTLTPESVPDLAFLHGNLGLSYIRRYERLGELDDIQKAIESLSRGLALTSKDDPDLASRHSDLGTSYGYQFVGLGKSDDLEKAIEHKSRALELTPEGHPNLPRRHASVGLSYSDRFRCLGGLKDLDKAIEHYSSALALTRNDHPDLLDWHTNLGLSYTDRFRRLGELADIENSIEHRTRALALAPNDDPDISRRHADLGASYGNRFWHLREQKDLEKAIEHETCALALTPDGHPDLSKRVANLGVSYRDRFRHLGELDDLEKAIEYKNRALALTPEGHPDRPDRYADLGIYYNDRFQRLGELDDLERGIEYNCHALTLTPNGHSNLSSRHAALGQSYRDRFNRLGELKDQEVSMMHLSRALALTPDRHPELPDRHAKIGSSYGDRFRRLGELSDLEKSLEHYSHALELTPKSHPDIFGQHSNLAMAYNDRFRLLGELKDLEKVTEHESQALALTPEGHPDLSRQHFNQSETLFLWYKHTGDQSYMEGALDSFRAASQLLTGAPRKRFQYALRWAKMSSKYSSLNPIEAYQTTVNLLPQFIWLGATTNQRYYDISTTEDLAVNAAYAAILHSDYKLALEWLEHTRCIVWNQTLMLRSPVEKLKASYPDLATRLQAIAEQLHQASSDSSLSQAPPLDSVNPEQVGQQRRRIAKEYDMILAEVRTLPGFEDFLLPMNAGQLVCAARNGPVVVLNCHNRCCGALLVLPKQETVQYLPLPNFTRDKAQNARLNLYMSLRRKGFRERGVRVKQQPGDKDIIAKVLSTLWNDIVKPVLDFLGFTDNRSAESLPHITWCPTGLLSFLPLHAAGDYDQPGSRVFDHVVSSYTPTLSSLLLTTPISLDSTSRVLAVGQEHTPGRSPLPGTAKELSCLKAHTEAKVEYTQLKGDQATRAGVLDAMEQYDWVHLACHAHQNVSDPTKSGFFLHDGTLDLATINRRSFKNKGLAFLSACQTATGDERLPDEAIHLASGMLMAGYPSVIATMWSVTDSDAPFVADKVYARLMQGGKVGNGEAGKALHDAVAALRGKVGEKEFARWVPYIHIGS